jgi:hypothetical protein
MPAVRLRCLKLGLCQARAAKDWAEVERDRLNFRHFLVPNADRMKLVKLP